MFSFYICKCMINISRLMVLAMLEDLYCQLRNIRYSIILPIMSTMFANTDVNPNRFSVILRYSAFVNGQSRQSVLWL